MHAFFLAADHLKLDARVAFGVHQVSSILINVEDSELIEPWAPRWPKGFKDKRGAWTETTVKTSSAKAKGANAVHRFSKPLPGSIVPDGVVVWRPKGKAAALDIDIGIEDLEPRALAPTGMDTLIRALAYATLAYWVRIYLDGLDRVGRQPDPHPGRLAGPGRGRGPRHQRAGQMPGGHLLVSHRRPRTGAST